MTFNCFSFKRSGKNKIRGHEETSKEEVVNVPSEVSRRLNIERSELTDDLLEKITSSWTPFQNWFLDVLLLGDNELTKVPALDPFRNLEVLDISNNNLVSLEGLNRAARKLRQFYAWNNFLSKIQQTETLVNLTVLNLGGNSIQVMEGLDSLTCLEELWLGYNYIRTINLCGLTKIVKLDLQDNCLKSIHGLEDCEALEELYLSKNQITRMEGLSTLTHLRVLDVSHNRIKAIEGIDNLGCLEDLWLHDNVVETLEGIQQKLSSAKESLLTIYLERNPCASDPDYKDKLVTVFPSLTQIDDNVLWRNFRA